jgi:hypothetical protein
MRNSEIAAILEEVADLLELKGVAFKPNAYRKAARSIRELTEEIIQGLDRDTYTGIRRKLEGYVASITGSRYSKVRMNESLPEGVVRSDGAHLDYALLSTGTKDALALARASEKFVSDPAMIAEVQPIQAQDRREPEIPPGAMPVREKSK